MGVASGPCGPELFNIIRAMVHKCIRFHANTIIGPGIITFDRLKPCSSWEVNIDQLPRQRYDSFKCSGTEASLSQCLSDGPYPYKCYSEGYAGVTCKDYGTSVKLHNKILAIANTR